MHCARLSDCGFIGLAQKTKTATNPGGPMTKKNTNFNPNINNNYLEEAQKLTHDLKTPLMILKGSFLKDEHMIPSQDLIRRSVLRLMEMSQSYLTAIETPTETTPKVLDSLRIRDIKNLLKQKLASVAQLAQQQGFSCQATFYNYVGLQSLIVDEPHPQFIQVQTPEFERIIDNLIMNALEAMSSKNSDPQQLKCSIYLEGENLMIDLQDTGVGCDSQTAANISVGTRCTTKTQGHGLGLSRASSLLKSWGAELSFQTQANKGSCVSLKFPLHTKPQAHEIN